MELQHTIRKAVACRGVGLHTGVPVAMTLSPAPPDHGIVFRITPSGVDVPVRPDSLLNGHYATTIGVVRTGQTNGEEVLHGLNLDHPGLAVRLPPLCRRPRGPASRAAAAVGHGNHPGR